jgi:hypothetical protein
MRVHLEIQLITHKEEEDGNDESSSEVDDNEEYGSNIYNLLRHCSSSVRCLLMQLYILEVCIYICWQCSNLIYYC